MKIWTVSTSVFLIAAVGFPANSGWAGGPTRASEPTVYVSFWFDTEDYLLPASDDAAKSLAEIFEAQGVQATFKVVGEKARVLRKRGRRDVIKALLKHDIGFHTNFHSVHPTPAEYSRDLDWDEGVAEFIRREGPGLDALHEVFGRNPACYGQPGSSWTPQSYGALRHWKIPLYLDDTSHIGLDGKPFWYCGVLNALNLRGHTTRAELGSDEELRDGCARFEKMRERVVREGGGLISTYYHPCEWVHQRFWDGVNFAHGANPPRSDWKQPPQRPPEETQQRLRRFAKYLEYVRTRPNVRIITASRITTLYPDHAFDRPVTRDEIAAIARSIAKKVEFVRLGDLTFSAAEALGLLARAVDAFDRNGNLSAPIRASFVYGPSSSSDATITEGEFPWPRWVETCRDYLDAAQKLGRMPSVVWVAGKPLDPVDFAATLGRTVVTLIETGKAPPTIKIAKGNWSVAKYVAEDAPRLWGWVIFPPNFRAPRMMALARLQSWTLKPAVLSPR